MNINIKYKYNILVILTIKCRQQNHHNTEQKNRGY